MSIVSTRAQRRQLARDNQKHPEFLQEIPRDQWPSHSVSRTRLWRSRDFLVQEFAESPPVTVRLTVSRTTLQGGRWLDGISWDDLQRLKRECGHGERDAVEIFPADEDLVNHANMRHLWVLDGKVEFAWRNNSGAAVAFGKLGQKRRAK